MSLTPARALAPSSPGRERRMVVASVPSGHVYVRHLSPEEGGGPVRLPDPHPDGTGGPSSHRWWPPAMLEPAWVEEAEVDLLHLHFGFDARDPADLASWTALLRGRGTPLVFTVHDLRNPHHESRTLHDRQLDVLVPAADRLVTLTAGAAAEIRRRWGRDAAVIPHPHVVPIDTMLAARAGRAARERADETFRVGVHVKSLRASMAPLPVIETLVRAVAEIPGGVLQVNAHRNVLEAHGARYAADLATALRRHADAGRLDLRVHDYLSDRDLWDYLAGLDASVLPYRFGTHSGWLEACRDVGTTVIAPTCGYFADQGTVVSYGHDEEHFDADSLDAAVHRVARDRPDLGASVGERRRQRRAVAAAHDLVYAAAGAGR